MPTVVKRLRGRKAALGYCCTGVHCGILVYCHKVVHGVHCVDWNKSFAWCIGDLISFDNLEFSTSNICGNDQRTDTYLSQHESSMCGDW